MGASAKENDVSLVIRHQPSGRQTAPLRRGNRPVRWTVSIVTVLVLLMSISAWIGSAGLVPLPDRSSVDFPLAHLSIPEPFLA